jgi:outer membrane receptor for ferrienterochelin and colicins
VSRGQQSRDSTRTDSSRAPRTMDAVVVTASRRLQRVSDAPVTTEVISRADVEKSGAQDLNALLTQYVGIQSEPGVAGSGGVRMEGLSSQHVLLLVDGQPMVGRIDGELDLSRVPAWMIDHVEIVKGPSSTLYGSSAMGGVINVITRGASLARPAATVSVTGGNDGRLEANGSVRGGTGDFRGLIGGGRREDDVQPGRADQAGARANRWDGTASGRWLGGSSGMLLDGSLFGVREDQRWQSGQLFNFSNNSQIDTRSTLTMPIGSDGSRRATVTAYVSQFSHLSRTSTLPEPASDSGDASTESLGRIEATYSGSVVRGPVLDAGIDIDRASLSSTRIIDGHRSTLSAEPYAQYTVDYSALSLVPGVRVSASDEWGMHVTPKMAALYHVGGGLALRGSIGSGYRAPEFKELYITFLNSAVGYVVHGNAALRPETSTNVSGGIEWTGARSYARVQVYGNRFSNFIESVEVPDSGGVEQFTYANVTRGETRGADVDGGVSFRSLSVDASLGLLKTLNGSTGLPLLGSTPRTGKVSAECACPSRFHPSVTVLYWSATPTSTTGSGTTAQVLNRSAFTRVDLRLDRPIGDGMRLVTGISNVLDAQPVDWPGNSERRWYLGWSLDRGF